MLFLGEAYFIFFFIIFFIFGTCYVYSLRLGFPNIKESLIIVFLCVFLNFSYIQLSSTVYDISFFNHLLVKDSIFNIIVALICLFTCLVVVSTFYYNDMLYINTFEYLLLIYILTINSLFLMITNHMFLLFLLLEIQTLSLFMMCAINKRDRLSIESSLKYFIIGSYSSILILLGISTLYLTTSFLFMDDILLLSSAFFLSDLKNVNILSIGFNTSIIIIAIGFLFKMYSAPFHFWVSEIYQGAATSSVAYFATVPAMLLFFLFWKIFFVFFSNIISSYKSFFYLFATLSLLFGTFGGLVQQKLKKILAYSSVNLTGYLILIVSTDSLNSDIGFIIFLFSYTICVFGSFVIVTHLFCNKTFFIDNISHIINLFINNNILSFCFSIFLFSLAGLPPFIGFLGKFELLSSISENTNYYLFLFVMIISTISFFFYLRIVRSIYSFRIDSWMSYDSFSYSNGLVLYTLTILTICSIFRNNFIMLLSEYIVFVNL